MGTVLKKEKVGIMWTLFYILALIHKIMMSWSGLEGGEDRRRLG